MRRVTALLVSLILATPLTLALAGPADAKPGRAASTYAAQAHAATNRARTRNDLRALKQSRCLKKYAARQAAKIAADAALSHQDLGAVLRGCDLRAAGENVAYGFDSGRSVVKGWMHSPGHRANILTGTFRREAIAAARGADGRWYVAQVFGR